jgi:hypothetical protein
MYQGLKTFKTLKECQDNLPKKENKTEEINNTIENVTLTNETIKKENITLPQNQSNEEQKTNTPNANFFKTYQSYIIGAIIIVIIIIIIMSGAGKKIINFFEEDVDEKPKKNGKKEE